ncbi:transcriptional regulator [Brachybacterium sp. FME24]|uniref:transcriptional regulator n=1 Tax=Brachybacterium sp. FME24 TaxID=2742605 RepID=UPI001867F967|nr:transcriptional regulator [Brachybacterium sp. FME24]
MSSSSPAPAFHEVIHASVRLRICGLLRQVDELEFSVIREALDLRDANLSKNLKVLSDAGLVRVRKEASPQRTDARRLTWVALTRTGRPALEAHLAALRNIADGDPMNLG